MKTSIGADGILTISPENELESYGLKKWCESNAYVRDTKKVVKVFENVRWSNCLGEHTVTPLINIEGSELETFLYKPPMKMTLEWEE